VEWKKNLSLTNGGIRHSTQEGKALSLGWMGMIGCY
jgi:hypothetical protein